jgi:putative dimethyl sulfoxide reductase chaperone
MKNSISDLEVRRDLYKLLSIAFNYPNENVFNEIKEKKYLYDLRKLLSEIDLNIEIDMYEDFEGALSLKDISFENFEANYISFFEANVPKIKCSLHEGHYRNKLGRNNILIELKAFYKNFGLEKAEIFKDSEDHISIELEFMHFLLFKEWQSTKTKIDKTPYIKCQKDFVDRHLSKWISEFSKNVKEHVDFNFFNIISDICENFLSSEIIRLEL